MKLQIVYKQIYQEDISSWYIQRIQRVIKEYGLYPPRRGHKGTTERTKVRSVKKRITHFPDGEKSFGFLLHLDTVEIRIGSVKRYILTAIDEYSRVAFVYAYTKHSSASARDLLLKLQELFHDNLVHIHTDNGSEFHGYFAQEVERLHLDHWFSRVRVSNDNGMCERFNRTLQDEVSLKYGYPKNIFQLNAILMSWLLEYLSIRPHQALNYLSPFQFLSTISSSSTIP